MTIPELNLDLFECRENGTFRVRSQKSGRKYWVKIVGNQLHCDCPDAQFRKNGTAKGCRHIWGTDDEPGALRLIGMTVVRQLQKQDAEHAKKNGKRIVDDVYQEASA